MSNRRKAETTSSHHGPYARGVTRTTMAGTEGSNTVRWSKSHKAGPSSDRGLKFALVKSESLVIADQPCCGECVPEPCHTARQATEAGGTRSRPPLLGNVEGKTGDWD